MWLGITKETWELILAVASIPLFLLSVAVAFVLTIKGPSLQNWWAARSIRSTQRRIAALTSQLEGYERDYELVAPSLLLIIRAQRTLISMAGICLSMCCATGAAAAAWAWFSLTEPHHKGFAAELLFICYLACIFGNIVGARAVLRLQRYSRAHSAKYRDYLRHSIEKLESHLNT